MEMRPQEIQALLDSTPDLPENASIIAMLQDLASAANVVKYPFTYTAPFQAAAGANSIAAGAVSLFNVQIDAGSPFMIVSQSYDANTANAARTAANFVIPNIRVLITETGSNRQMMDVAVAVYGLFGSGLFPYVLPIPKLMQPNSQLQIQATNHDAAAGYNLSLYFHGYKIYKLG
jgi:hypothetical protein